MDKYSFFYKIPDNWCWTKLGKITSIIGGGTPSSKINEYYDNGDIAWITPSDLSNYNNMYISKGKKMITKLGLMKSSAKLLPKGTVCLSSRAPIGYVVIAKNELSTNQGFKSFLPSKVFKSEYLYWYLKSIKHILEAKASGTTFLELSAKKAGEVEIPLPPISEQQRIVNRIESLFAKLDRAKELIENTLAQFEQNKMAILHKAFTGELTAKWRKENNIDLSSWKKCELKEVFKVVKDKYNPQTENQIVNYIGLENIETSKGIISKNNSSEVKSIKTKFKKDDVLYGKLRPYLNKHDVVNFDGICSTDILVFRFNDINTAKYINYYFNLPMFIQYAVENSSGINLPRVSEKTISKYKISLPTIEEQQEIINILDKLLAKYNKIKNLEQQLEKIELLKKAILAKAFRGELGTNNPDEESAENLLKEILAEK
ncbi:restriction endonuclease subunit S [Megamonas funiformis]|uniref:restriction endonuclease subunit S n=1 Tax=Megamonas funiformis TaxID=437897 RepID=UPI0035212FAC